MTSFQLPAPRLADAGSSPTPHTREESPLPEKEAWSLADETRSAPAPIAARPKAHYLPTLYAGKYKQTLDPRGYVRVHLPKDHPFANSGSWCWRHRLVVGEVIGRRLLKSEHAHHLDSRLQADGSKLDTLENLELALAEYHGSIHGYYTLIAGLVGRAPDGRFVELDHPIGPYPVPRFAAIIGNAAARP